MSGNAAGRNLKGRERDSRDYYGTPEWAVRALYLECSEWPKPTLDPCAGTGNLLVTGGVGIELDPELVRVAVSNGKDVRVGDGLLRSYENEHVILNPPYRDAERWVRKSVREAKSTAALLRLGFLASLKRYPLWKEFPPQGLVILSKRPSFRADGKCDAADYAWFLWGDEVGLKWCRK